MLFKETSKKVSNCKALFFFFFSFLSMFFFFHFFRAHCYSCLNLVGYVTLSWEHVIL